MPQQSPPTGTISSERLGSRTFPDVGAPADHRPPSAPSRTSPVAEGPQRENRSVDDANPRRAPRRPRADGSGVVPPDAISDRPASDDGAGRPRGGSADAVGARTARLERENATLRAELAARERQLQDVIDRYERLLAQRNESLRRNDRDPVVPGDSGAFARLVAWLSP